MRGPGDAISRSEKKLGREEIVFDLKETTLDNFRRDGEACVKYFCVE